MLLYLNKESSCFRRIETYLLLNVPQIQRDVFHHKICLAPQTKLSENVIKHYVAEMGKAYAVVSIDCGLCRRLDQRVCILLVWKRAERPGKYLTAKLGDIV
jgi:hypothetical protein